MRQLSDHTVLITGAGSGIGLALARAFHAQGARVIATGRNRANLAAVRARHPGLSILVNNAAVQHLACYLQPDPETSGGLLAERAQEEIAVNCAALVDLTVRLLPTLRAQADAAVVFVSSGLALAPKKSSPVYCATKAFVHSFAKSLRYQCEDAAPQVHVMEVLPPLVDTPMTAGRGRGKISPAVVARATLAGLRRHRREVNVGKVSLLRVLQRLSPALADRLVRNF